MRGQEALSRMRLGGYKPAFVWLLVLDKPCSRAAFSDAESSLLWSNFPEIHVGSDDHPAGLDFRPLVGTTVLLQGSNRDRMRSIYRRLRQFEPARIISSDGNFFHDTEQS